MFEIRNYHFDPARFDEYKKWAETLAVPYIKGRMDVVGFWVNNELAPEYGGTAPRDEKVSPANVTWIIRWRDKSQREKAWKEFRSSREWHAILAQVPGGRASYFRTEAKFATEV